MAASVSWKLVFEKARKTFFLNRRADDLAAHIAVSLFQETVFACKATPAQALDVLSQQDSVVGVLVNADGLLATKFHQSIEQARRLENLEQSSARIEAGVVALQTISGDIHAAAKDITSHTLDVKMATNAGLQLATDNADTARVLKTQVGELKTHAAETEKKMEKLLSGTRKRVAIIAGCASGFVIALFPGMPLNVLGNYYYERHWSKEARGESTPQSIVLQFNTGKAGDCLPPDTFKKLKAGQSVTLPTGMGKICLVMPVSQPVDNHSATVPNGTEAAKKPKLKYCYHHKTSCHQ